MAEFQITTDASLVIENMKQFDGNCRIAIFRDIQFDIDSWGIVFGQQGAELDCRVSVTRSLYNQSDIRCFVFNRPQILSDCQLFILNSIARQSDVRLAVNQNFLQMILTTVRVTHSRQALLETFLRISAFRELTADTAQHLEQRFGHSADAGLTIFNVIINEEHEIQT